MAVSTCEQRPKFLIGNCEKISSRTTSGKNAQPLGSTSGSHMSPAKSLAFCKFRYMCQEKRLGSRYSSTKCTFQNKADFSQNQHPSICAP